MLASTMQISNNNPTNITTTHPTNEAPQQQIQREEPEQPNPHTLTCMKRPDSSGPNSVPHKPPNHPREPVPLPQEGLY